MPKTLLPNGVEICYETFGSSTDPALLLIHGLAPAPVDPREQALKDLSDRRIWASTEWHDDEYCLKIFERYAERTNKSNEAKDRQMEAMNLSGNREEALMKIKAPTLVLHGSADTLVDPSGGQRTAEVIPEAKFVMIEGWGHDLPPGSWPKITNEIIKHVKNAEKRETKWVL